MNVHKELKIATKLLRKYCGPRFRGDDLNLFGDIKEFLDRVEYKVPSPKKDREIIIYGVSLFLEVESSFPLHGIGVVATLRKEHESIDTVNTRIASWAKETPFIIRAGNGLALLVSEESPVFKDFKDREDREYLTFFPSEFVRRIYGIE